MDLLDCLDVGIQGLNQKYYRYGDIVRLYNRILDADRWDKKKISFRYKTEVKKWLEKELRFDFINLGLRGDTTEFKAREWSNCVDILPILPKREFKDVDSRYDKRNKR